MSFFRKKSLFILLIGIILLVVLVGYSLSDREELSTPEKFVMDTVGWVQSIINKPISLVVNTFSNIEDIKHTYEENEILRGKLSEYKTLVYDVQEIEKENEELRKALDIVESSRDFEPIISNVIARSPERWLDQITINRGSRHGVKKNMAVMTVDGMIGKVKSTSPSTAKVQLITGFDQLNRISATVSRKDGQNIFGLIEGYDKEKEMLVFTVLEQSDKELKEDELVVSSNLGGLFPDGLPIGTIKEVTPDQYGLTKTAYIEPAASMFDLNQVIVVDRTLETQDESTENEEDSQ